MVATHSQPRRPSNNGGSMGHSYSRSKRRSSLRRQSEKISTSILPPTVTLPTASNSPSWTPAARGNHNGRRSRSVSAGSQHHLQQSNYRRPSAPAVVEEMPRLSIADRFMSTNFTTPPPPPPLPSSPYQQQRNASPSISIASNSASSDIPATGSNSKLSVADRFMNNSSSPTNSTLSLSGIQQHRGRSGSSSFSAKSTTWNNNTFRSYSISNNTLSETVPRRLTIANAFMKSSNLSTTINNNDPRSRAILFGELDLGVINKNIQSKSSPAVHPLEEQQRTTISLFDDTQQQQYLNLDLSILPSSASSSVLNGDSRSRPWGSQDTLVYHYNNNNQPATITTERKKPIYAHFIESEKNATMLLSDNRSFIVDYYSSSPDNSHDKRTITMSDDLSTKHDYDDYDDIEIGGDYDKQHWSYNNEEEDKSYHERNNSSSRAVSTTKLKKHFQHDIEKQQQHISAIDYDNNTRGFWVGCCFISCGQRPSRQTIEQRQKQRREKETERGDIRPKNRGFGRRGWVFCTFLSLLIFVLITYFLWPRTPLMRIEGASLTYPAKITETKQGIMVGNVAFESEWLVNITVDNRQNHVPTRLVQVQVLAKDALTGLVIGKGLHNDNPNPEHIILAPNTISTIQIPIHVDYQARDSTDTTFVDLSKACSPQHLVPFNSPDSGNNSQPKREALPLHFWITLHFFGLDWLGYKPTVIATPATGGFACPQS